MLDEKECPKCEGTMTPGKFQKIGTAMDPLVLWAPSDWTPSFSDDAPDPQRKVMLFCCENCGFVEIYAHHSDDLF